MVGNLGTSHRREKALNLLAYWAFSHYALPRKIEISSGYTSQSILASFSSARAYKPFCFKLKTNAEETRPARFSSIPIGGLIRPNTKHSTAQTIDAIFMREFSPRAFGLLLALFMPPGCFGGEGVLSEGKKALVMGFKPRRASQIKQQAIALVIAELLAPKQDTKLLTGV